MIKYIRTVTTVFLVFILSYQFTNLNYSIILTISSIIYIPFSIVTALVLAHSVGMAEGANEDLSQVQVVSKFHTIWTRHQSMMIGLSVLGFFLSSGIVLYLLYPFMGMLHTSSAHLALQIGFCVIGGVFGALAAPGLLISALYTFSDDVSSSPPCS